MNAQKFTQKSLEAIQEANNLALSNNNMQIEQEHLLYALLTIDQSLIAQLIKKMGKDPQALAQAVKQEIDRMPGVTGSGREAGKIYVAQDVDTVLAQVKQVMEANGYRFAWYNITLTDATAPDYQTGLERLAESGDVAAADIPAAVATPETAG